MAFFDLFTIIAGSYPADQFFQVVFKPDPETGIIGSGVTLSIGPRSDHTQVKQYTIADKEAFATDIQTAIAGGATVLDALHAHLPDADETVTEAPIVAIPPVVVAPTTETTNETETPATETTAETTTDTPTADTTTPETPVTETPTTEAPTETTTTEAPQDQS